MAGKPASAAYSAEELDLLSDEERAGLEDPDLIDDEPDAEGFKVDDSAAAQIDAQKLADEQAAAQAAEEAKAKTEADAAAAEKAAADAKAAAEAEAAAAAAGAAGDDKAAEEAAAAAAAAGTTAANEPPKTVATPLYPNWQAPENAQEKLDEIERKKDELAAKFDDGDMTAQEFREKLKPLEKEERQIRDDVFKANISRDANRDNYFQVTVPNFLGEHPEYAPGEPLYNALDVEVKSLQAKAANPFDPKILEDAHKAVREKTLKALGVDPATLQKGAAAKAAPEKDGPRAAPPPTLANVPAADLTETGTISKFAYLDKLTGTAYEDALAKLSDVEREQYLQEG